MVKFRHFAKEFAVFFGGGGKEKVKKLVFFCNDPDTKNIAVLLGYSREIGIKLLKFIGVAEHLADTFTDTLLTVASCCLLLPIKACWLPGPEENAKGRIFG